VSAPVIDYRGPVLLMGMPMRSRLTKLPKIIAGRLRAPSKSFKIYRGLLHELATTNLNAGKFWRITWNG